MIILTKRLGLILLVLSFSLFGLYVFSDRKLSAASAPETVQITIGVIHASAEGNYFDPKLERLKNQLVKVFNYRSYRLLKEDTKTGQWQAPTIFDIPGGRVLTVTPQELRDNQISLKIKLVGGEKPLVDTQVTLANRGNFLLGGPSHEKGVLILSISAASK